MDSEKQKKEETIINGNVIDSNIIHGDSNTVTVNRGVPVGFLRKFSMQQWAGIGIVLFGLLATSIFIVFQLQRKVPEIMTSEFPIAIASFAERGAGLPAKIGYIVAGRIQTRLVRDLEKEATDGLTVSTQGPDTIGVINGDTPEIRAAQAAQLAQTVGAGMVIYGVIEGTKNGITITPELYLEPTKLYEGAEITGQYGLSIALPLASSPRWEHDFDEKLKTETTVISAFAKGLDAYAWQNYASALTIFQEIDQIKDWDDDDGRKTLYALTGFAASKVGERDPSKRKQMFAISENALSKAINIDPQYARPYIGLASLAYLRALEPVIESNNDMTKADYALIQSCISSLEIAQKATHKPPLADVETKIHFQRGQCRLLETYSGHSSSFDSAESEFKKVIEAYAEGANKNVAEFAGESYARLAIIYTLMKNPDRAKAADEYRKAADILKDISPERAALYRRDAEMLLGITPTP